MREMKHLPVIVAAACLCACASPAPRPSQPDVTQPAVESVTTVIPQQSTEDQVAELLAIAAEPPPPFQLGKATSSP